MRNEARSPHEHRAAWPEPKRSAPILGAAASTCPRVWVANALALVKRCGLEGRGKIFAKMTDFARYEPSQGQERLLTMNLAPVKSWEKRQSASPLALCVAVQGFHARFISANSHPGPLLDRGGEGEACARRTVHGGKARRKFGEFSPT